MVVSGYSGFYLKSGLSATHRPEAGSGVSCCQALGRLHPLAAADRGAHRGEILSEAPRMAEAGQLSPSLDARRFSLPQPFA